MTHRWTFRRAHAGFLIAVLSLALALGTQPAAAQPVPKVFKLGEPCARKTDTRPGVVKRDACGRWYCSRTDVKDIIEIRPNIAAEMGCTWRLEGDHCKCRRPEPQPQSKDKGKSK